MALSKLIRLKKQNGRSPSFFPCLIAIDSVLGYGGGPRRVMLGAAGPRVHTLWKPGSRCYDRSQAPHLESSKVSQEPLMCLKCPGHILGMLGMQLASNLSACLQRGVFQNDNVKLAYVTRSLLNKPLHKFKTKPYITRVSQTWKKLPTW